MRSFHRDHDLFAANLCGVFNPPVSRHAQFRSKQQMKSILDRDLGPAFLHKVSPSDGVGCAPGHRPRASVEPENGVAEHKASFLRRAR